MFYRTNDEKHSWYQIIIELGGIFGDTRISITLLLDRILFHLLFHPILCAIYIFFCFRLFFSFISYEKRHPRNDDRSLMIKKEKEKEKKHRLYESSN